MFCALGVGDNPLPLNASCCLVRLSPTHSLSDYSCAPHGQPHVVRRPHSAEDLKLWAVVGTTVSINLRRMSLAHGCPCHICWWVSVAWEPGSLPEHGCLSLVNALLKDVAELWCLPGAAKLKINYLHPIKQQHSVCPLLQ